MLQQGAHSMACASMPQVRGANAGMVPGACCFGGSVGVQRVRARHSILDQGV
jgi:hypothetical protein